MPSPAAEAKPATGTALPTPGPTAPATKSAAVKTTPAPVQSNFIAPRAIRREFPQVPSNLPGNVTQVQVQVSIDARGKVTKANPVDWNPQNAPLMIRAVRAASVWVFDPALLNGQPIPSEMTLTFRF
jgi:hypothetical protein